MFKANASDRPVIVLLPGMDGTGVLVSDFVAVLEPEIEAIVVTYPNDLAMGYAELETVVRAKLPDRMFFILGESFSGPIAISIAESPPRNLCGLILCCSFVRSPRRALSWFRILIRILPLGSPGAIANWLLLGRYSSARLRSNLSQALGQVSPAALRTRLAAVAKVDVSSKLAGVRVPALYLRASDDRLVPASAGDEVMRILPAAGIAQLKGPHFLLQTAPADAARRVKEFVYRETAGCRPS